MTELEENVTLTDKEMCNRMLILSIVECDTFID